MTNEQLAGFIMTFAPDLIYAREMVIDAAVRLRPLHEESQAKGIAYNEVLEAQGALSDVLDVLRAMYAGVCRRDLEADCKEPELE